MIEVNWKTIQQIDEGEENEKGDLSNTSDAFLDVNPAASEKGESEIDLQSVDKSQVWLYLFV